MNRNAVKYSLVVQAMTECAPLGSSTCLGCASALGIKPPVTCAYNPLTHPWDKLFAIGGKAH